MINMYIFVEFSLGGRIVLAIFFAIFIALILYISLKIAEIGYVIRHRRPVYVHFPFFLKSLTSNQKAILNNEFQFYRKLKTKHKRYFEHRVASFIKDKQFVGRESLLITDEMKVLISATAVMITFGFRDYYIGLINKIFIYPSNFISKANNAYHKGEFNPRLRTLVLSWKHFRKGFETNDDNVNLGIHEFAHAIHLNSIKERDISSTIFSDSFKEMTELLTDKKELREELVASNYFRNYAFTNQFEFLAVIIESFIQTPEAFRSQFPEIYKKTKQMLNFNFAGY